MRPSSFILIKEKNQCTKFHFIINKTFAICFIAFLLVTMGLSGCSGSGEGASQASAKLAAPTGLIAESGDQQVSLVWSGTANANSYSLYRGTASGKEDAIPDVSGIEGTSYVDKDLQNGTTYYYEVAAANDAIISPLSNEANATPQAPVAIPTVPDNITAAAGSGQITLSWNPSSTATSYNIYRAMTSGDEGTTPYKSGITSTSYVDAGLVNGETYYYTVSANNSGGISKQSSEVSATPAMNFVSSVQTNASRYNPGATATITAQLTNITGANVTGSAIVTIAHLGTTVATLPSQPFMLSSGKETTLTFSWPTPNSDFMGYSLLVTAINSSGVELGSSSSAIDVSSTWTHFPRYGYVATYPSQADAISSDEIAKLNRFHIDGIQFYDWQWEHHVPLAGTVANPAASWVQLNNQMNYRQTILDYISAAHKYGMAAMNYNLLYGAWADYETDDSGVQSSWGLYKNTNASSQYNISFTNLDWATPYIYIFDPGNTQWRSYIIGEEAKVFQAYPFDGWHVDQLGPLGTVYDYTGHLVNLASEFPSFLSTAGSTLNKTITFNDVGGYGLPGVLSSENFAYVECWPDLGQTTYNDLKSIVDGITASKPGMGVVLAAYMDYDYASSHPGETFNTPGVLLTDAAIFASGASHLELGVGSGGIDAVDMLDNEYFPNRNLSPTAPLLDSLKSYYDFDVAYENLLRGGFTNSKNLIYINGSVATANAMPGEIWAFAKSDDTGDQMLNLINLTKESSIDWRDDAANYPAPQPQVGLSIKYYYGSKTIKHVYWASPDMNDGQMNAIPFTTGVDSNGAYLSFTLPSLIYWDMVYLSEH